MDKHILEKRKQILSVQELLANSKISSEGYDSTIEPFFNRDFPEDYKLDHKELPEYPESINRHIKLLYECIGNPDVEIYINDWTIMSLNKSLERYKGCCEDNQEIVFDIAFQYAGMGHINVLSCDLSNHLLFIREDGGSNGWEREANYKDLLNYKSGDKEYMYFTQWKNMILKI